MRLAEPSRLTTNAGDSRTQEPLYSQCSSLCYLTATEEGWLLHRGLCTGGEGVSQAALATVLAIFVESHEGGSATLHSGAFATEAFDLAVRLDFVVFQDRHLDLLALVLDLLRSVISLLLPLLGTTTETQNQVERGLLLDVIIRESAAVLQLLSGEDQTLLVGRNSFLVLDFGLDIVDGV